MKHLISIADLSKSEILGLMDEADRFAEALEGREMKKLPTLRGRTVFTMFYENSTRTRSSFETAGKWMSADVINISASSSSVKKGESLRDTALTLKSVGADAIIMRHPSSGAARQVAGWLGDTAVINAGDGSNQHPTQALLDATTMRNRIGDISGKKVVIVGDILHSRVARSNAQLLTTLGAEVVFVAPPTLVPLGIEHWGNCSGNSAGNGGGKDSVRVSYDFDSEIADADVVMMLRVQAERMHGGFFPSAREYAIGYGLSEDRAKLLPGHATVLHPGPMIRGMEIAPAVADAPNSAVLAQVRNGVHVRMAVLYHLLAGAPE